MINRDERMGPRARSASRPRVTDAQGELLDLLDDRPEPVTAAALADECGLHPNTVREHLEALVERGLVSREALSPKGRGRPAYGYRTREVQDDELRSSLLVAMLEHIATTDPDPAGTTARLGRDHAARLAPPPLPPASTTPAGAITQAMTDLGFEPRRGRGRSAATVRLRSCPMVAAARRVPAVVCGFHLGLVQSLAARTGADPDAVRLQPFAEPGACLLHLP